METPQQINPEIPKYKLIFLGDQSVGKSCILNRFMNDTFTEEYQATIGLDFQSKNVQIDNQDIHLLLYDTAGQEKFRSLIPMYTRDANIILLVYDVSSKDSFKNLKKWINIIWVNIIKKNIKADNVIFAVVGNKIDLENQRKVSTEDGEDFAYKHNFLFAEVSAKEENDNGENEGVNNLLKNICNEIIKKNNEIIKKNDVVFKKERTNTFNPCCFEKYLNY